MKEEREVEEPADNGEEELVKSECAEENILEERELRRFIHNFGGVNPGRRRAQTRTLGLNQSIIPWVRSHSLCDAEDMCKCR